MKDINFLNTINTFKHSAPFGLTFSAKSANLGVKGGQLEFLNLFTLFRKLISFIYEIFFQGDRVPLSLVYSLIYL